MKADDLEPDGHQQYEETIKWDRILYRKMNVPDNYSDEKTFLKQLRKNETVVHYTFAQSASGACLIMTHINLIILYMCTFEYVQIERLTSAQLSAIVSTVVLVCANVYLFLDVKSSTWERIMEHARTFITLLLFGYGFTPIIRTLTTSISTDTIYAISFGLFFASLVFQDYGLDAPIVSATFSANLSLAASVFLISRVQTDQLAFCLLTFSLCAFCFWPRLRNLIVWQSNWHRNIHRAFFLVTASLTVWLVSTISVPLAIIYLICHVFVILICPLLLVKMQHHKSTIHGPWDEAYLRTSPN